MILDILRASLEELVHRVGAWMFLLPKLPGEGQLVSVGQGEGKVVSLWAGKSWWRSWGACHGWGGLQFLVCRFSEEEQLCVTSCLALSKPFFLSEPPGFFLCKWRC